MFGALAQVSDHASSYQVHANRSRADDCHPSAASTQPCAKALNLHDCPLGRDEVADERDLQKEKQHRVESKDHQDLSYRSVSELLEVVKRGQIGDAGKCKHDTDGEGDPRRSPAQ